MGKNKLAYSINNLSPYIVILPHRSEFPVALSLGSSWGKIHRHRGLGRLDSMYRCY